MILLHFLRLAGDLALYYSFAGFFVACTGQSCSLPGLLLPSLCYALSATLGRRRGLALPLLLPMLLCFPLPWLGLADRIALLPAVLYPLYLVHTERTGLSHYRQVDVFTLFIKVYPLFFLFMVLIGGYGYLAAGSLPMAALTLVLHVYLMQVLRHEAEMYTQPAFLLRTALPLLVLVAAAGILQLPALLGSAASLLLTVYNGLVIPLVMGICYVLAFVFLHTLYPLLVWLLNLVSGREATTEFLSSADTLAAQLQQDSTDASTPTGVLFRVVAVVLLVLLVSLLLLAVFRRMAGNRQTSAPSAPSTQTHTAPVPTGGLHLPLSPTDPVNQVRRQYKKYLRLCRSRGFNPHPSYTSQEIQDNACHLLPNTAAAQELRRLYLSARYAGVATKEDAARAKTLVQQLHSS